MNISRRLSRASSGVCFAFFITGLVLISRFENGIAFSFSDPDADFVEVIVLRAQNRGRGQAFALRGDNGEGRVGRYWCVVLMGAKKDG
jgi:hypothetical protein